MDKSQYMDHYFCNLKLSIDGSSLLVYNLKPTGYQYIQQDVLGDSTQDSDQQGLVPLTNEVAKEFEIKKVKELLVNYNQQWDDRISVDRTLSKGSFKIKEIKGFVYGGNSSRFWALRKHINSMQKFELMDLPFYCWECITI